MNTSKKILVSETDLRRFVSRTLREARDEDREHYHNWMQKPAEERTKTMTAGGGIYGIAKANQEAKLSPEQRLNREMIARGEIPVGVKLAIETDGEPMAVYIGTATLNGTTYKIGKIYSKAYDFNPIGKYGSIIPAEVYMNGDWQYPEKFVTVTDKLIQVGNKKAIAKKTSSDDPFGGDTGEEGVQKIISQAPALAKLGPSDPQRFYKATKFFIMNQTKGLWYPPKMAATAAGFEKSQQFGCAMSKSEFAKEVLLLARGDYLWDDSKDFDRLAPCFSAVADSMVYDIAAAIVSGVVSAFATPLAGAATYATLQIAPMVPVLVYHIKKGNVGGFTFYLFRMVAAVYGGATEILSRQIIAALIELVSGILSTYGAQITDYLKSSVMSWVERYLGKPVSAAIKASQLLSVEDPQGLAKLYPNL